MITLYQFESCPFCSKVRALLQLIDQPFEIIEVSPFGMKELDIIDYKKVPVLADGEMVVTESSKIIEYITKTYTDFTIDESAQEWTTWIDETLVHYITPLVHPNFKTSVSNFKYIVKTGQYGNLKTKVMRFGGALFMPRIAKKLKAKYNIEDAETEFLAAIDHWVNNALGDKTFYGGDNPNFVDSSVYGVMNSCHNLGVVKTAIQHNQGFADWYNRCMVAIAK